MTSILVTTAISYPNDKPHIGHMYEAILADIETRKYIINGCDAKLLTGTDEHGKKIQQKAESQSITPKELCDINSQLFKDLLNNLQVKYDRFIRTTDVDHLLNVESSIESIPEHVQLGLYEGYYNVREETFISKSDAIKTDFKDPVTNIPYEEREEICYMFKLSNFKDYIVENLDKVHGFDTKEFKERLDKLEDLSITRVSLPSFNWGIKFPFNDKHIVYVWFDALLNYITGLKSLYSDTENVRSIHVIGKDIVWFHSVIYPAILKACKYPIYDKILVHGFITDENGLKMSKSLGNVIDPNYLLSKYSIESIRFYLFLETNNGNDIKFSETRLVECYNNILCDGFYNLFNRIYNLISRVSDYPFIDISIQCDFEVTSNKLISSINNLNTMISRVKPWTKTGEDLNECLITIGEFFFEILVIMSVIIPDKIKELNSHLGFVIPGIKYDHQVIYEFKSKMKFFEKIKV